MCNQTVTWLDSINEKNMETVYQLIYKCEYEITERYLKIVFSQIFLKLP